jgi:hypothetical protein
MVWKPMSLWKLVPSKFHKIRVLQRTSQWNKNLPNVRTNAFTDCGHCVSLFLDLQTRRSLCLK